MKPQLGKQFSGTGFETGDSRLRSRSANHCGL